MRNFFFLNLKIDNSYKCLFSSSRIRIRESRSSRGQCALTLASRICCCTDSPDGDRKQCKWMMYVDLKRAENEDFSLHQSWFRLKSMHDETNNKFIILTAHSTWSALGLPGWKSVSSFHALSSHSDRRKNARNEETDSLHWQTPPSNLYLFIDSW